MKDFEFAAPRSEGEVLALLSERPGHTELLAGGTDLVGLLRNMIVQPERVVSLNRVDSWRQIERDDATGEIVVGALVALDDLFAHPLVGDYPAVTHAIAGINSMQLRAQGTLGGELCRRPMCWYFRGGHGLLAGRGQMVVDGDNRYHAILGNSGPAKYVHPSRIAPGLIALGAVLRIIGPSESDEQLIPLEEFYRPARSDHDRETVLAPNQVVSHVILPPAGGSKASSPTASATYEVRHGEGPDMPLVAAAAMLHLADGVVQAAKVVLGQVAPTPWVSPEATRALVGRAVTRETARAAGDAAIARATPLSNNEYKVALARTAVERAILRAAGQEIGGF